MTASKGWTRMVGVSTVAVLTALLAASCGDSSGGASSDEALDPTEWIAVELRDAPDGYEVATAGESSYQGRWISYGDVENAAIGVNTRVPTHGTVDEMLATAAGDPGAGTETRVGGHRAIVRPTATGDTVDGWEVVWEPDPSVQVSVRDQRTDAGDGTAATPESVLALAETARGIDRDRWDDVIDGHGGPGSRGFPPPGAVEREVADGALDGRQWTLSVLGDPDGGGSPDCYRLGYAGEDTGTRCALERVVLGGKGFVLGFLGAGDDPGELVPGPGSSFDPIEPAVQAYGDDPEWRVSFAVLPDGACGVLRTARSDGAPLDALPRRVDLLPGDPGVVECSNR